MFRRRLCCCDGSDPEVCANCLNSDAPVEIDVTFAGITNDGCDECANLNSTYRLTILPTLSCGWGYLDNNGLAACDPIRNDGEWNFIHVRIGQIPFGDFTISVFIYKEWANFLFGGSDSMSWNKASSSRFDCLNLENYDIPQSFNTTHGDCDNSSATCTITSVPL